MQDSNQNFHFIGNFTSVTFVFILKQNNVPHKISVKQIFEEKAGWEVGEVECFTSLCLLFPLFQI